MMVDPVLAYLEKMERAAATPDMGGEWSKMSDLYSRRLWHQLSSHILATLKRPEFKAIATPDMYNNFFMQLESKISPAHVMELILVVRKEIPELKDALEFLEARKEAVKGGELEEAHWWIKIGEIKLLQGDMGAAKEIIDDVEGKLKNLEATRGVTPVHGPFYLLCSEWYKKSGDVTNYYKTALQYLGCTELKEIPTEIQVEHAKHLVVAAIVSDKIYSFGDLLAHPILNPLIHSRHSWLVELLVAFNTGDIHKFEEFKKYWERVDLFKSHEIIMNWKIKEMALIEFAFKRDAHERRVSFGDIARACGIKPDGVELLVMRAGSKELIKASIDEVDKVVTISWVLPRALNLKQIGMLKDRMDAWRDRIKGLEKTVESYDFNSDNN